MTLAVRRWVFLILRLGLGGLFLYAGVVKVWDMGSLAVDVANYRLVPAWAVPAFAVALPGVEIVCGACLVIGRWARPAAWLAVLMMLVFSVATGQALARGISLDCGCFGSGRSPVTAMTLVRDLALLGAALLAVWTAPSEESQQLPTEPPSTGA